MTGKIILWLCALWIAPLIYFMMRNETRFKKNLAVGVTLPQSAREDGEVLSLLRRFGRQEGALCLGLLAAGLVCLLLPVTMGVSLMLFLLWVELCVFLPAIPYARCNRALKALKERRGWRPELWERTGAVADLSVAAQLPGELGFSAFLWPLLVSLIPPAVDIVRGEVLYGLILLIGAACVLLFYAMYRWAFRRKAEVVDENSQRTAALTRVRRQYWRRMWLWSSWAMAALSLGMWLCQLQPVLGMAVVLAAALALGIYSIWVEFHIRGLQERLTADSGTGSYVDEDDKWIWGMFYYDPNDSRLIVNDRVGMNTTVNLARRAGRGIAVALAVILLAMPLLGVWIIWEERSPVVLSLEEGELVAAHAGSRYEIPLEEIADAALLEELPAISRIAGTAMDTVDKGRYRAEGYGNVTACLNPQEGPWLLVVTADGRQYLLSATDPAETAAEWQALR